MLVIFSVWVAIYYTCRYSQAACMYVLIHFFVHITLPDSTEDLRESFPLICHKLFNTFFLMLATCGT